MIALVLLGALLLAACASAPPEPPVIVPVAASTPEPLAEATCEANLVCVHPDHLMPQPPGILVPWGL